VTAYLNVMQERSWQQIPFTPAWNSLQTTTNVLCDELQQQRISYRSFFINKC